LKKNILLIIRRGELEVSWICPALFKLKEKFNIYVYFLSKESYLNVSSNKFYFGCLNKVSKKIIIQPLYFKLLQRTLRQILSFFYIKSEYLNRTIHDPKFLLNKFKIDIIDIAIGEYNSKSQWFKNLNNSKIIFFPNSPQIFWKVKQHNNKSLNCDYLLVNSKDEINYWKKRICSSKIIETGCPQKDKWWDDKIKKFYLRKVKPKKKLILFAYNSFFNEIKLEENKNKLHKNLNFFLNSIFKISQNIQIIFKLHPNKNHDDFLKTLRKFSKDLWLIKNEPLQVLIKNSDLMISMPKSSAYIDGLYANKPSILYFNEYFESLKKRGPTVHEKMKLDIKLTKKNLNLLIKKALYDKKNKIWKRQKRIFSKFYLNKNNASIKVFNFIKSL
jgi:hypothetical protein